MIEHTSEYFTLLLQDAIEGMKHMPENSFDLCIADPLTVLQQKQNGTMTILKNSMVLAVVGNY